MEIQKNYDLKAIADNLANAIEECNRGKSNKVAINLLVAKDILDVLNETQSREANQNKTNSCCHTTDSVEPVTNGIKDVCEPDRNPEPSKEDIQGIVPRCFGTENCDLDCLICDYNLKCERELKRKKGKTND